MLKHTDDDVAVDTSFIVVDRVDKEMSGLSSHNAETGREKSGRTSKADRRGIVIDSHRFNPNSKKFDGLEVVVLATDEATIHPLGNFQLSNAVLSFSSHQHVKNQRVKYSTFVSQKKQLRAKGFTATR